MSENYYNSFLGILYVSSDLTKRHKSKLDTFIDKTNHKYKGKAYKEFARFLKDNNLEINMGMVSELDQQKE